MNIYGNIVVFFTFTENSFHASIGACYFGLQVSEKYYISIRHN